MKLIARTAFHPEEAVGCKAPKPAKPSKTAKPAPSGKNPKNGRTAPSPAAPAAPAGASPLRASALSDIAIVIIARTSPERSRRIAAELLHEAEAKGRQAIDALMARLGRLLDLGAPDAFCFAFTPLLSRLGRDASLLPTPAAMGFVTRVISVADEIGRDEAQALWTAMRARELLAGSPAGCDSSALRMDVNRSAFEAHCLEDKKGCEATLKSLADRLKALTNADGAPSAPENAANAAYAVRFAERWIDHLLDAELTEDPRLASKALWIAERAAAFRCGSSVMAEARAAACAWRAENCRQTAEHAVRAVRLALAGAPAEPVSLVRMAQAAAPDPAVFSKLDESDDDRRAGRLRALAVLYEMFTSHPAFSAQAHSRLQAEAAKPYPASAEPSARILWLFAANETNADHEARRQAAERFWEDADDSEEEQPLVAPIEPGEISAMQPAAEILSWTPERRRSADGVEALCAAFALADAACRIDLAAGGAPDKKTRDGFEAEASRMNAALDEVLSGAGLAAAAGDSAALAMVGSRRTDPFAALLMQGGTGLSEGMADAEEAEEDEALQAPDDARAAEALAGFAKLDLEEIRRRREGALDAVEAHLPASRAAAEAAVAALERLPVDDDSTKLANDALDAAFASMQICTMLSQSAWKDRRFKEAGGNDPAVAVLWDPFISIAVGRPMDLEDAESLRRLSEESWPLLLRALRAVGKERAATAGWTSWLEAAGTSFAGLAASAEGDFRTAVEAERLLALLRATKAGWGDLYQWRKAQAAALLYLGRWQEAASAFWEALRADGGGAELSEAAAYGGFAYEAWRRELWTDAWKRVLRKKAASWLAPLGRTDAILSRKDGRPLLAAVVPKPGIGTPEGIELLVSVGAASIDAGPGYEAGEAFESEIVFPIEAGAALPWWASASADPLSAMPGAVVNGSALWTSLPDPEEEADRRLDEALDDEDFEEDFGDEDDEDEDEDDGFGLDALLGSQRTANEAFVLAAAALGSEALPSAAWRALRSPEAKDAWLARSAGIAAAAMQRGLMARDEDWGAALYSELLEGAEIERDPEDFGGYAGLLIANAVHFFGHGFPREIREGFDSRGPFDLSLESTPFAQRFKLGMPESLRAPAAPPAPEAVGERGVPLRAAAPLYAEEIEFVNFYGLRAFLARAAEKGVSIVPARRGRPNVCEGLKSRPVIRPTDVREIIPAPLGEKPCFVTAGVLLEGRVDAGVRVPTEPNEPDGGRSGWLFFLDEELKQAMRADAAALACFRVPLNAPATLEPALQFVVDLPAPVVIRRQPDGSFAVDDHAAECLEFVEGLGPDRFPGWGQGGIGFA